jgi:hypothetical protein
MGHYKVNSMNSSDFILTMNNINIGELKYSKWYSFKSEMILADNSRYQLEPKGFWDSKIELKQGEKIILYFEMGWKGIVINLNDNSKKYLLRSKGLLSSKFVLIDTDEKELLAIESDFKWTELTFNFNIETSNEFDNFENKEVLLLTTLHCVNYYMAFVNSTI